MDAAAARLAAVLPPHTVDQMDARAVIVGVAAGIGAVTVLGSMWLVCGAEPRASADGTLVLAQALRRRDELDAKLQALLERDRQQAAAAAVATAAATAAPPQPEEEPELELDSSSTLVSGSPSRSPPSSRSPPHGAAEPPGSAERWLRDEEALAFEAAATSYISESSDAGDSPRPVLELPAKIIEADDKELELEVAGKAYLVDRTSSCVFPLDDVVAGGGEPLTVGTWDEASELVSFYIEPEPESAAGQPARTVSWGSGVGVGGDDLASPPPTGGSSAAGSSPSPPGKGPQGASPQQDLEGYRTLQLAQAREREEELLSRLDELRRQIGDERISYAKDSKLLREALSTARNDEAAASAKWRREIGNERIAATTEKAAAEEAAASARESELRAELNAAESRWRREVGAERISAAEQLAARDTAQSAAAKIQRFRQRKLLQRDFRAMLHAHTEHHFHALLQPDRPTQSERSASPMQAAALEALVEDYKLHAAGLTTGLAEAEGDRDALLGKLDTLRMMRAQELGSSAEEAERTVAIHKRALVTAANERETLEARLKAREAGWQKEIEVERVAAVKDKALCVPHAQIDPPGCC